MYNNFNEILDFYYLYEYNIIIIYRYLEIEALSTIRIVLNLNSNLTHIGV